MTTAPTRRRTGARPYSAAIITATTALLLSACGLIMGEDIDGLRIPITNNSGHDLVVRQSGGVAGHVDAGSTATVEFARVECVPVVNAITEDQSLATRHPGEVCEGDSWVVEQGDLRPYYEVFPLMIDVANFTDHDLTVHSDGVARGRVAAHTTTTLEFFGLQCTHDLVAVTDDEARSAFGPGEICEVGRWEISPEELRPVTDDASNAAGIVEPLDGSTVLGEVLLRVEGATGATVTRVDYLIDATVVGTATAEPFGSAARVGDSPSRQRGWVILQ